jgi:hypothetical protein
MHLFKIQPAEVQGPPVHHNPMRGSSAHRYAKPEWQLKARVIRCAAICVAVEFSESRPIGAKDGLK